jgi:transposase
MPAINSTLTLKPTACLELSLSKALELLAQDLKDSQYRQQEALEANATVDCTQSTGFSNTAARTLIALPRVAHPDRLQSYNLDEMDRSEVYRILSTWQQRCNAAQWLEGKSWNPSFDETKKEFVGLKWTQWRNIVRARAIPNLPVVRLPRLVLAKTAPQYSHLKLESNKITLITHAWDSKVTLEFKIPPKIFARHPQLTKVTRPTIRWKDGDVLFDFTLVEQSKVLANSFNRGVSFDIGLVKPTSGVRMDTNGSVSPELLPSIESYRCLKSKARLDEQIISITKKNKAREALGCPNPKAVEQEGLLRAKRLRVNESLDWQSATDIVTEALPDEAIILEQLNWGSGGPVKFRHSSVMQKVEHLAKRHSRKIIKVSAKGSSHECPLCNAFIEPDSSRLSKCSCGWVADRDYTASIIHGKRGLKIKSGIKLTPECFHPAKVTLRKRGFYKSRLGFTGPKPTNCTGFIRNQRLVRENTGNFIVVLAKNTT